MRNLAKATAAAGFSTAILLTGLAAATTANAESLTLQPAPVADSGSGQSMGQSMVQSGSGTGSVGLDLPTAAILCKLTGGSYSLGLGSSEGHSPSGCTYGAFGRIPQG